MAGTAPRVRWDRLGRLALLFVGVLLVGLYVNPLRTYVATSKEASTKRAEVAELQREHTALVRRQAALRRAEQHRDRGAPARAWSGRPSAPTSCGACRAASSDGTRGYPGEP